MPFAPDDLPDEQRAGRIDKELEIRGDRFNGLAQSSGPSSPAVDLKIMKSLGLALLLKPFGAVVRQGIGQNEIFGNAELAQDRFII